MAQDADYRKAHARLYERVSPAVVGIRSSGMRGSGTILHRKGWILTSILATGQSSENVWVYLKGHRRVQGKVVERFKDLEAALVKIDPASVPGTIEWGDSESVRVGQIAYALGDSFDSIFTDDQVALSMGRISGVFELRRTQEKSIYKGMVLETSAAVNPGGAGGPLVDSRGRLIGMLTMNYHEAKFTSLAIPVQALAGALEKHVPLGRQPVWSGLLAGREGGKVVVTRVSGPADRAGIRKGDVILSIAGQPPASEEDLDRILRGFSPGDRVEVKVRRGEEELSASVQLEEKEFY
jgi:S1-C subfamily serine protease